MTNVAPIGDLPVYHHSLPPGRGNVLCRRLDDGTGPAAGLFRLGDRIMRIEVPDPGEVLFPTDVGTSLLPALAIDYAVPLSGARVLDIGSGSGLYVVAALLAGAAHATALDLNPDCAAVTLDNVRLNGLDPRRVRCVTAGLAGFRPETRFDLVVTNPPHFPYDLAYARGDGIELAAVGGFDGRLLYDAVVQRVDDLLAPGGTLLMAHSSLTDIPRTRRELAARGYGCTVLGVCELDIPLLAYAEHRPRLLANLARLRQQGRADFSGTRFTVQALAFRR